MVNRQAKERKSGKMELFMKGIGLTIWHKVRADLFIQMEMYI
jgi:hypothetical protein